MMNQSLFLKKYEEQAVRQLKLKYPKVEEDILRNIIIEKALVKMNNNKFVVKTVDYSNIEQETTMLDVFDYIERETPIISGFGALYRKHSDGQKNILLEMVQMLLDERKVYKKKKFQHTNDIDKSMYNLYDLYQLTFKLLNNSFFGAAGQPQSIFFDEYFPQAILYTGQIIITTSLTAFENFSDNYYFDNMDDLYLYIERTVNSEYKYNVKIDNQVTKEKLVKHLCSKFEENPYDKSIVVNLVDNLTDDQLNKVYYRNNFLEFIKNKEIEDILSKIVGHNFPDPNEPSEEIKEPMELLWDMSKEYCLYNHINRNRTAFSAEHKRRMVLVVDTDSNFLYNRPFTDQMRATFPNKFEGYEENKMLKLSTVNISMFILTKLIAEVYNTMGGTLNIDEYRRPTINMKNEFFYSRLEMTPSKKHYSGILWAQEGVIFDEPKLDMKGLALRKTSLNMNIREYFTDTLTNKILNPKQINLPDVYADFIEMENKIRNSFKTGDIDFVQPGKINEISSYAVPYQQQTVRGTLLWNVLFPENAIQPPNKVNFVKLKPIDYTELINKLPEDKKDAVRQLYAGAKKYSKDGKPAKELKDYPISIICFPKNLKKLPDTIIDLIDIDVMVHDQIKPAMEIIEPLGFKALDIDKYSFATNIIDL